MSDRPSRNDELLNAADILDRTLTTLHDLQEILYKRCTDTYGDPTSEPDVEEKMTAYLRQLAELRDGMSVPEDVLNTVRVPVELLRIIDRGDDPNTLADRAAASALSHQQYYERYATRFKELRAQIKSTADMDVLMMKSSSNK